MKQINVMRLFINGASIGQVVDFEPPQNKVEPINAKGSATIQWPKPRWATPRNSEDWQGRGKRRKPKLK